MMAVRSWPRSGDLAVPPSCTGLVRARGGVSGGRPCGRDGGGVSGVLASDRCRLEEMFVPYAIGVGARSMLWIGSVWAGSWSVEFRTATSRMVVPVAELGSVDTASLLPMRAFSWSRRQRHRPGLQFMVSTGRHHGFESMEEQRLLLALDFAGLVVDVVSQPLRLRFETVAGAVSHIPDFLAVTGGGVLLFDVRPAARIGDAEQVAFAATAEAALSAGWGYRVVAGWRGQVLAGLEALSAQRRDLPDPDGVRLEILERAA